MLFAITLPGIGDITGLIPGGAVGIAPIVLVAFIAFVLVFRLVLGVIKNIVIIGAAALIFPFLLSAAGYGLPLTLPTFAAFFIAGIAAYALLALVKLFRGKK